MLKLPPKNVIYRCYRNFCEQDFMNNLILPASKSDEKAHWRKVFFYNEMSLLLSAIIEKSHSIRPLFSFPASNAHWRKMFFTTKCHCCWVPLLKSHSIRPLFLLASLELKLKRLSIKLTNIELWPNWKRMVRLNKTQAEKNEFNANTILYYWTYSPSPRLWYVYKKSTKQTIHKCQGHCFRFFIVFLTISLLSNYSIARKYGK